MSYKYQYITKRGLVFFLLFFSIHIRSSSQSVSFTNNDKEYKKIVTYIHNGCSENLRQFRKDSLTAFVLIKYYINPRGAVDSIVSYDNTDPALRISLQSMEDHLVNWNKLLAPSANERVLAIPLFIGPEDVQDTNAKSAHATRPYSITSLFSFPQCRAVKFKEQLYLMDPLFCLYYVGKYTKDIIAKQ